MRLDLTDGRFASAERVAATSSIRPWAYLLMGLIALAPFILVPFPPIVDFPNHAARLFITCHRADPVLAVMYDVRFGVIPDLAVDAIGLPLCGLMAPERVVMLTLATALAVIFAAAAFIQHRLFGRTNPFLLFVPALAMNLVTMMGYVNYLVGIAASFGLIALLVAARPRRIGTLLLIGNACGTAIFFLHIFALIFVGLFLFGWLWATRFRAPALPRLFRAALLTGGMLAVPALLTVLVEPSGEPLQPSWEGKLRMLLAPFLSGQGQIDGFIMLLLPGLLVYAWRKGLVRIAPGMAAPLIVIAAGCVILPTNLKGAVDIDARLAVPLLFLLLASIRPAGERRIAPLVAGLAVALLAAHALVAATLWRPFSRQVTELREASAVLPAGAPVLSVRELTAQPSIDPISYWHFASYATMERRIFNPLEFSARGMQPLSVKGRYAPLDTPAGRPVPVGYALTAMRDTPRDVVAELDHAGAHYVVNWGGKFPYVLYYHFGTAPNFSPGTLRMVKQGSFFSILATPLAAAGRR